MSDMAPTDSHIPHHKEINYYIVWTRILGDHIIESWCAVGTTIFMAIYKS